MFFSFNRGFLPFGHKPPMMGGVGPGLLFNGILCILFGIAILMAPELLAYIVATFLIIIGVSLLVMWWKVRGFSSKKWF